MLKVVKGEYGLVMRGCSPPVLTISVSYSSSGQKKNNVAHDLYDGYEAPYEGRCNLKREGNGRQNPVPTSRRLLAESPTSRRSLLSAQQTTCYRRVVTIVSAVEELGAKCRWVNCIQHHACCVAQWLTSRCQWTGLFARRYTRMARLLSTAGRACGCVEGLIQVRYGAEGVSRLVGRTSEYGDKVRGGAFQMGRLQRRRPWYMWLIVCRHACMWYICEQAAFARWVCGVYV